MSANDEYQGEAAQDNDYVSRPGQSEVPVVKDDAAIEDPIADDGSADSDEQLAKDDAEAINEDNIIDERTRGAGPQSGSYTEPGDEEGLPGPEDGTSSGRQ